ncbi:uncharacterized protein F5147DRAFT_794221 [Suillus discolor]|uniref:S1 motif domain-containing protein n=1 Tax=Suillus discolor TaxID=1912936 RepID=A0A9P7EQR5_9AGAM|nr:uncharacterized protein F5147DRAFT_794221 [Suillus discolor]KAG2085232.1 hypothetical protein F5147DRAFT_794221 [Suillus discolor]
MIATCAFIISTTPTKLTSKTLYVTPTTISTTPSLGYHPQKHPRATLNPLFALLIPTKPGLPSRLMLVEFLIYDYSKSFPNFKLQLSSAGAEFPDSFFENMDRLILSLHLKHKKKFSLVTHDTLNTGDTLDREKDKQRRLFPGIAVPDKEMKKDVLMKEVDDMMAQFEGVVKRAKTTDEDDSERPAKRERRDRSQSQSPRHCSPSPDRGHNCDSRRDDWRGRNRDEWPVLFKIYSGRISSLKEFGTFVQLEGVAGCVEGMVHVSNIQQGARANSVHIGLSIKDVDQATGRDLTPYLHIKSEAEMEEEHQRVACVSSGANAMSDLNPDLNEDFVNPVAQMKRTLDLSPVKIIKAPNGSLDGAALRGAALAKERCELHQQEANEQADSEARDFSAPSLLP